MRVIVHRPGGYERLTIAPAEPGAPAPDELQIRVRAIGVNYADCLVRRGLYASARDYVGWPITPGFEVAGEVVAAGAACEGWTPGDPAVAVTRFGGYAGLLNVPAAQVFRAPATLTPAQAAALPTVFLTAWYALHKLGDARPGARVLIHSAAGGVGGMLVQLAKRAGCIAVGVVGASHKVEAARAHGADVVIDKSREPLWTVARARAPGGFEVVCDANGVETLRESYRHLAPTGRLIVYGFHTMLPHGGRTRWLRLAWNYLRTPRFNPLALTQENRSVMGFNLSYLFEQRALLREGVEQLLAALADGSVRAPAVTCYPLARVAEAHRALESGQTVGKLVLEP
ncbi:MAG: zinc-binding dehydrogenase [Myxococcales bacterium]|nr:zinc-binding dehydrogenase [Myxococcales bacterium]